jgi:hypothetical protein
LGSVWGLGGGVELEDEELDATGGGGMVLREDEGSQPVRKVGVEGWSLLDEGMGFTGMTFFHGRALEVDGVDKPVDIVDAPPAIFLTGDTLNTLSSSTRLGYIRREVGSVGKVTERTSCLG